jgi:hypothetical protein
MFILDPDFFSSRIPDPSTTRRGWEEKVVGLPFFLAINFVKLNFIFEQAQKKNLNQLTKNGIIFTQKVITKLSEMRVGDLGSEIWDPEKLIPDPDPGFKKAPDSGSAALVSK